MTEDDMAAEIGRAYQELKTVSKKVQCLEYRLRTIGDAAMVLAGNHLHAESEKIMESASDIREDFFELRRLKKKQDELREILKD